MTDRDELIRFALGELDDAHAARIAEAVRRSPEDARVVASIRDAVAALRAERAVDADFSLPDGLRAELHALAPSQSAPSVAARALGAVATLLARLVEDTSAADAVRPAIRGGDESRRLMFDAGEARVTLRLSPSLSRLDAFDCVGRISGVAALTVAWCELDAEDELEATVDEDGFFEVVIRSGRHQVEVRLPDRTILAPEFTHPDRTAGGDRESRR